MRLKTGFWPLGLTCLALVCVLTTAKSEKDAEVDQLQTEQDSNPEVKGGCPLSGQFLYEDTHCWVSTEPSPSPDTEETDNSYCQVVSGPEPGLFRCEQGIWIPEARNTEKPLDRQKKGWWRRRRRTPPPNTAPYFTSCPSDMHVTALPNEKYAVATFTVQASDKQGGVRLTVNQGRKSGSRFPDGQTLVRYTATDTQGLTASCTFRVNVKVVRCPNVAEMFRFPHGSQSCSGTEKNLYGSICRHTCIQGYELDGPAQVMCLISSTWSSAFPSCKTTSCGDPGQVDNGRVVCPQGQRYPGICLVTCSPGYENFGVNYITCGINGQWTARLTHCTAQKTEKPLSRAKKGWWRRRRRRRTPPPPPPAPNQAPHFTSCPTDIHVTAPANRKDAIVTFNVQAADKEGHATLTLNQGAETGSRFREGETFMMYTATDTKGLTATCTFNVRVTVNRCPYVAEMSRFPQGSQTCSGSETNIYGSVCNHTCYAGHVLKGQARVTCQSSRSWSSAFPSCQPVSCGDPGKVAGGQVECPEGHVYPYNCIVQCHPGYDSSKVTMATCLSTGKWSAQFTPCIDSEAPQFPNGCPSSQKLDSGPLEDPVTVTWVDPEVTDNSNQNVTLTSDLVKGSKQGPGQHTVTLTATDEVGNEQECNFRISIEAKQCPALLPPDNGQYTCTRNNVEGSACTASCDPGYSLKGTATQLCLPSEQWDNSPPTCEAITCPPISVDHGSLVCPSGHQHPARCVLSCDEGYQVQGPVEIQCLENSTWSATRSCKDVQAPQFLSGCPLDIQLHASALGSDTVATWTPPSVTDNSRDAVDLQSDVTPGASFQPGTTRVTYKATDAAGNVASCNFSVIVTVLECLNPSDALTAEDMAANLYTCAEGHVQGAMCTVKCSQGYALVGESTIKCMQDNRTYPPTAHWQWADGLSGKPVCREDKCPIPAAPKNGALSCHLGTLGTICQVSCQQTWDLTHDLTDHLSCINERATWSSDLNVVETGCVRRRRPNQPGSKAHVHYFAGSCNSSAEELRQAYVTRMQESNLKDACIGAPSCTAKNVKVFCATVSPFEREGNQRLNSTHYYHKDSPDVHVPFAEGETFRKDPSNQRMPDHSPVNGTSGGKVPARHPSPS